LEAVLRTTSFETAKPLTIVIGGNYPQRSSGTLVLGIGGLDRKDYEHVQAGGAASLNGTLEVDSLNGFRPGNGNAFEVLHSGGSRTGQFAQINDFLNNDPNLQRIDVYGTNGVALVYEKIPTPVPSSTPSSTPSPAPTPVSTPTPVPTPPAPVLSPPLPLPAQLRTRARPSTLQILNRFRR
jgi:hypothetical protein